MIKTFLGEQIHGFVGRVGNDDGSIVAGLLLGIERKMDGNQREVGPVWRLKFANFKVSMNFLEKNLFFRFLNQ